jgi:hypothetical protein
MHRSLLSLVVVSALSLAACTEAPSAPAASAATARPALASYGADRTYNDVRVPVHHPIQVPCARTGMEIVPLDGVEHASFQLSQNAAGGLRMRMHVNAQGVTGVGLVSGDAYHASGTTEESYEWGPGGAPEGYYLTYTFNVTSPGATGNIVAHEVLRMSFDAAGYPSLDVVKFDAECR